MVEVEITPVGDAYEDYYYITCPCGIRHTIHIKTNKLKV